jgi:hypothetical protein
LHRAFDREIIHRCSRALAQIRVKPTAKDKWSKSLRLLQRALMTALAEHGTGQRPFVDGPAVQVVDIEIVRAEFYKSYPADGDATQKRAARQKAFRRAINEAQASGVIVIREVGHLTWTWLASGQAERGNCHKKPR